MANNNITFIVGNGLDLALRLDTKYRDFYKYVRMNKLHPENQIYKAIAAEDPELWADFELGLGKYTNSIETIAEDKRAEWSQKLNDELDEIKRDLKQYVQVEDTRIDDAITGMEFSRDSFYQGLEIGQIQDIQQYLTSQPPTALRFITLNYTNALEKLFPSTGRLVVGQNFYVVEPIHHIHGSLARKISLGVNDESQLSSYVDAAEKPYLIKPQLIELMNDGRMERLNHLINASDVIVLFGLSLGATDQYIWNKVVSWLHERPHRRVIIHYHQEGLDVEDLTERESIRLTSAVQDKLLNHSTLSEGTKNGLKRRIYVIPNTTELFTKKKIQPDT